jgi:hybrid cluster-associated redox disulfide protein
MVRDIDDPDLPLGELFRRWPEVAPVFWRHGAACVGCPIAPFHTVVDTCAEYHLDEAVFRTELRSAAGATLPPRSAPPAGAAR